MADNPLFQWFHCNQRIYLLIVHLSGKKMWSFVFKYSGCDSKQCRNHYNNDQILEHVFLMYEEGLQSESMEKMKCKRRLRLLIVIFQKAFWTLIRNYECTNSIKSMCTCDLTILSSFCFAGNIKLLQTKR